MKRIAISNATVLLSKFLIVGIWSAGVFLGLIWAILNVETFGHYHMLQPRGSIWGTVVVALPLISIFLLLKFDFHKLAIALLLIKSFLYSFCYFSLLSLLYSGSFTLFSYALFSGAMTSVVSILILFSASARGSSISGKWLYTALLIIFLDLFFCFSNLF